MSNLVFQDNVVIITGASSGIGREMAYQLAPQGARLVLSGRDLSRLEATAERCRQAGAKVLTVTADLTRQEECRNLIQRAVQEFGRIDTLINNAGNSIQANLEDYSDPTALEQIVKLNYLGSAYCTFYALPTIKQSRGRIVAVCSMAGVIGFPGLSGYVASKHAMSGFFEAIRPELKPYGVSVTIVYPASIASHVEKDPQGADKKLPMGMMPVETCARLTLQAAASRRRELYMAPGGKLLLWIKLIAPGLLERFSANAVEKDRAVRKEKS
jgi:short-subunit dehydrogenase